MKPSKPFSLVTLSFLMFSSWVVLSASSSSYKRAIPTSQTPVSLNLAVPQYALSFNNAKGGPDLVSWHLKESDTRTVPGGDLTFLRVATPQCEAPSEVGRWRNLDGKGEPAYIDIKMVGCGDQVLNGEQTSTSISYTLRVWVKQPTGKFYGRPTVKATYRAWKNQQWLFGRVPTGGYEDQLWMRVVQRGGQANLHVLIRHQSLDIKPSASSEYWFSR